MSAATAGLSGKVTLVTGGGGELRGGSGQSTLVGRGQTIVIPYGAGACDLRGDLTAIRCRASLFDRP